MTGMTATRRALGAALALTLLSGAAAPALADDVKLGFLGGFTGPIETLTPPIFDAAKLAVDEINAAGGLSAGSIALVQGDTGCGDAAMSANAADRLVNAEGVVAIVGALCSGATIAAANNAAIAGGVVMVSPASTSPSLTALDDKDLVYRTATSDAAQGVVLAKLLAAKGVGSIAITYVNNDYGKPFAEALGAAFEAAGGAVAASEAHEDNKADYRAEIGSLESVGADALVVIAYANSSGETILRQASESGVFTTFVGGDGMVGDSLIKAIGADALAGMIATKPGAPGDGAAAFSAAAEAAGLDPKAVFAAQAYDAAFLLALAMEKNGAKREGLAAALRDVASAPGAVIMPGEWAKAKAALAEGKDVNYEGAVGGHEFDAAGDVPGAYVEMTVKDGAFVELGLIE